MSRLPPSLLYLTIYNPSIKPSGPIADDDDDAEEQAHILFYTSRERAVSRDRMLRQVGLAKALINFSEMFVLEDACDSVHSQSRRMLMISPEPGFWIHACVELAKTPRPVPPANKGKSKDKGKSSGTKAAADVVYDYHDGSVHDPALRAQVLRGYEEFKLTHGSFTSILDILGQQALELQLERFFTVWAWKWDILEDSELGNCIGVPLHPLYKSIVTLLDDFTLDHPVLNNCAPFVLAHQHIIPSHNYAMKPPSPALPFYVRSRLQNIPTPFPPATPSEISPTTSKPGTDIFASSMNVTREAMEATGQAFVAIGASMDVRKWSWPGYLTFSKGSQRKSDQPTDAEKRSEEQPAKEEAGVEGIAGESVPSSPGAELQGDIDRESLHEAILSDGIGAQHEDEAVREDDVATVDLASQSEAVRADVDITPQSTGLSPQDEQDPSPPPSPSTPIVHPPNSTSPPSPSSSQSTLPVLTPAPSFRSFSLHFSPHDDSLATLPRQVLYISKDQLVLGFLEPPATISEEDNVTLYQASSALLANIQGLIDHEEANSVETPFTAAKILQPKDKYLIVTGKDTMVKSAEFSSRSEHIFNGSQLIANGDATEVFSRTQGPQHWHIARREQDSAVYLEVLRKETSLADVENELVGIVRRFRDETLFRS